MTATIAASIPSAFATEPVGSAVEPILVHLDQAKLLKLPEQTATLVVGNPLIADASAQAGGTVVITAKSYGTTNLVALDRTGTTLMEQRIRVVAPSDALVVVYRGVERESYSCSPTCQRRLTIGDTQTYFTGLMTQVGTMNTFAQQGEQRR